MKPNTSEIIDSVIWSLKTYVEPEIESPFARSVMLTVANLLRHVKLRAELEAQLLFDDIVDLAGVLARIADRLGSNPALEQALGPQLAQVRSALQVDRGSLAPVPSVEKLAGRSEALRECLDELLNTLTAGRGRFAGDADYGAARQEIRHYLARQLEREGRLVTPAFVGGRR